MSTLVVGASGATGKLLIEQLLQIGHHVKAVVRSPNGFSDTIFNHDRLTVVETNLYDASEATFADMVHGCDSIISCLGHNLSFKGIFGHPRRLVTEVTRRLCLAAQTNASNSPIRFVLMNTAGNSNRDLEEPVSLAQRCTIQLLRFGLPPHCDNELAADYLRKEINSQDAAIEWVVVRPDTLINEPHVSRYDVHSSPTRSAIFNPGKSSRINVAHFMSQLIADDELWNEWCGKMPVIYNAG